MHHKAAGDLSTRCGTIVVAAAPTFDVNDIKALLVFDVTEEEPKGLHLSAKCECRSVYIRLAMLMTWQV